MLFAMKASIITALLLLSASLSGALGDSRTSIEHDRKVRRKDACGKGGHMHQQLLKLKQLASVF
jgi:hypothetical protein